MKKNKLLIGLVIAACSSGAFAGDDDEINYSLGVKAWNSRLGKWTGSTSSTLVSGTVRKGDYFAVASFLLPSTYTWSDGSEFMTRRDADLAIGWRMNSNITLLAGQKKLGINDYYSSKFHGETMNFTYVGANASHMFDETKFVYGQVNTSLKGKSDTGTASIKLNTYEAGIGFVVSPKTQMSVGFRSQKFTASGSSTVDINGVTFGVGHNF